MNSHTQASQAVKLLESTRVRSHGDAAQEKWYCSVVDVVQVLTDSSIPKRYWSDLRRKLEKESGHAYEEIVRLKMPPADGRLRETDAADVPTILRLVQAILLPNAEPFKRWLAKVGHERMQEMADHAQSLDRARESWQKLGRSTKWIQQRMMGQETRKKLTDDWKESGVEKADEFALLTHIIHQEWLGLSVQAHK
jgi:DNA-damage-inducible protein D